ncbi:hypothetical protein C495_00320 [Natronorubrum sulfidifaciens JCM 14089]|uniref:Uncharacterized protein n=1 Tax=Natronorubrum sulfidifaciens JCM 14089 TaxID=1230460 RepID=L9WLY9_9EURY|nr:hypothetical protein C495_00320 [Natronorubrum sulfidifaciens JCM 14089]
MAAVVVLVAAYVVTRVLGSSDDAGDDPLDRTTDAMGDERSRPGSEEQDRAGDLVTIPIKEPRSDDSAADAEPSTDTNERDDATDEDVSEE